MCPKFITNDQFSPESLSRFVSIAQKRSFCMVDNKPPQGLENNIQLVSLRQYMCPISQRKFCKTFVKKKCINPKEFLPTFGRKRKQSAYHIWFTIIEIEYIAYNPFESPILTDHQCKNLCLPHRQEMALTLSFSILLTHPFSILVVLFYLSYICLSNLK